MANHYYLMASLPTLHLDTENLPITHRAFLSLAKNVLSVDDYYRLRAFNLQHAPKSFQEENGVSAFYGSSLENKFWGWEVTMRNELIYLRAKVMGVDPTKYIRPIKGDASLKQLALRAFEQGDPLKVEQELNMARWDILEKLRGLELFNFDGVLIYSMQLQILTRKCLFTKEAGQAKYDSSYARILGEAETVLTENIQ